MKSGDVNINILGKVILRSLSQGMREAVRFPSCPLSVCICMETFLVSIVVFTIILSSLHIVWIEKRAFGDGLAEEQISSSLGSRKADLIIKMNPPIITNEILRMGK